MIYRQSRQRISKRIRNRASTLARAMHAVADRHENDMLANQYRRTATKIETIGAAWSMKLDEMDSLAAKVFVATYAPNLDHERN